MKTCTATDLEFIRTELQKFPHVVIGADPDSYISATPSLRPVFCTMATQAGVIDGTRLPLQALCLTPKWACFFGVN